MKMFLFLLLVAGVSFLQASEHENRKRKRYTLEKRQQDYQNPFRKSSLEEKCLKLVKKQAINYFDTLPQHLLQLCESYLAPTESLKLKQTNKKMNSFTFQNGQKVERLPITGYHNIFENSGSIQVFRNVQNENDIKWQDPQKLITSIPWHLFNKINDCLRLPEMQRPNGIFDEVSKITALDMNVYKFLMKILFKVLKRVTKRHLLDFGVERKKSCCKKIFTASVDFAARGDIHAMENVKRVVEILRKERRTILQILFGRNPLDEVFVGTDYRNTFPPLTYAAYRDQMEVVKILLQAGAKVDAKDALGRTALIFAARNANLEMVNYLLEKNANVDLQGKRGETALSTAAFWGRVATVKALIEADAQINLQSKSGKTALMKAAYMGHFETVNVLLQANAKIDLQNKNKETAEMTANRRGYVNIAVLINQYKI